MAFLRTRSAAGAAAVAAGARVRAGRVTALTVDELVEMHPDREEEIRGRVAEFVRELADGLEREGEDDSPATPEGEPAPAPPVATPDAAGDDDDATAAGDDDDHATARAAPATIAQLEALGGGAQFALACAKAQLTVAQARDLLPVAQRGAGPGGGGPRPVTAGGGGASDAKAAFLAEVERLKEAKRLSTSQAYAAAKESRAELYQAYRAAMGW